jgi:hypothetical protein
MGKYGNISINGSSHVSKSWENHGKIIGNIEHSLEMKVAMELITKRVPLINQVCS